MTFQNPGDGALRRLLQEARSIAVVGRLLGAGWQRG